MLKGKFKDMFIEKAAHGVQGLKPYQPGKPIEELEREYGITNIIKLASNENPLGPTPTIFADAQSELQDISRYPDDSGYELKKRLADKHAVDMNQLTLGNGSCNVLELLIRTFVEPGDEVVFSQYAFAMYYILSQAADAKMEIVPTVNWGHDLDAMLARISDKTKLVFIANPNNPTGTWLEENELKEFVKAVPENVIIVIDEAYFEYASYPAMAINNYPDTSGWIKDHANLVVTRTFSKAYALAGLRIGYGIASTAVTDLINRVRQPFNVNNIALVAAMRALEDEEHLKKGLELNYSGMKLLTNELNKLDFEVIPSAGNFVFVDFRQDASEMNEYLLRSGIIVRPVGNYGLANHLRISVGLPEENRRLLETISKK